jgi:hypothetical protein
VLAGRGAEVDPGSLPPGIYVLRTELSRGRRFAVAP